jgi:hypothetical protein
VVFSPQQDASIGPNDIVMLLICLLFVLTFDFETIMMLADGIDDGCWMCFFCSDIFERGDCFNVDWYVPFHFVCWR